MSGCEGNCPTGSCEQSGECRLPPGMLSEYDLNAPTADGLMIWLEIKNDGSYDIEGSSIELLCKAREIYEGRIFGVVFGDVELKPIYNKAFAFGIDTLYHVKNKRLTEFHPEAYCQSLEGIAKRINPSIILMSATSRGIELAPRLAASLEAGLVSNCLELNMDGNTLKMMCRPFNGSMVTTNVCIGYPQMATVRPGTFKMTQEKKDAEGTVIYWQYAGHTFKEIISSNKSSDGRNINSSSEISPFPIPSRHDRAP